MGNKEGAVMTGTIRVTSRVVKRVSFRGLTSTTACAMLTPMNTTADIQTMGDRISALRNAAGISIEELAFRVKTLWWPSHLISVTSETIRKYERDEIGKSRPNIAILLSIADALDVRLSDIAPELEDDAKTLLGILVRSRCYSEAAFDMPLAA